MRDMFPSPRASVRGARGVKRGYARRVLPRARRGQLIEVPRIDEERAAAVVVVPV